MLISYKWLQEYFDKPLPSTEKLVELLTFHVFEVESIEAIDYADKSRQGRGQDAEKDGGGNFVLDVKVLPDRAHYALCHRGVALEVSAITGIPLKEKKPSVITVGSDKEVVIEREASDLCTRYIGRYIENVRNITSPKEIVDKLSAMGGNTHGAIVDATNIVLFDIGQPLHAFDADKVVGTIHIRLAKEGEKITTLDGKMVTLAPDMLVIADDAKDAEPLAIAGVKGGMRAVVTDETINIILESAHFDPASVRRTSTKLGIRTDASKRFENEITPHLASEAMEEVTALILSLCPDAMVGKVNDSHDELPDQRTLVVSKNKVESLLGIDVQDDKFENILSRLFIGVQKKDGDLYTLLIPHNRLDITIPEDIIEEVGRLVGYGEIGEVLPPILKTLPTIPKAFYYEWKIRELLISRGFSEVMTSSFRENGEMEIEKPLAEDKKYLRTDLINSFKSAFDANVLNTALFGTDTVDSFEIGRVFVEGVEECHLVLGTSGPNKKQAIKRFSDTLSALTKEFGLVFENNATNSLAETNITSYIEKLPEPKNWDISTMTPFSKMFAPFSLYPFISRDVALFVPEGTLEEEPLTLIREKAGDLLVKSFCFDRFAKDGKQSYAYRLVFQAMDRTLTDVEIEKVMMPIIEVIQDRGWQIR